MNDNNTIKVLMLVPSLRNSSGVASFAISYFRKINHAVVKIDFACYNRNQECYAREIESTGSKVFFLPPVKHLLKHYFKCKSILKNGQYDIIHNCSLINTIPMMFVSRNLVNIRVFHSHSSRLGETKIKALRNTLFLPLLLSYANAYAACSDLAAKAVFGNKEYSLIPNVIDSNKFNFNEKLRIKIRNEMQTGNKLIIGSIGRAASPKNPFRALRIIKSVLKIYSEIEYWWVGNGPLLDKMKEYAYKLGIEKSVHFFGNRNDVSELYLAMDVFLMPSRFEGMPVACIEAQATGLPCIVSDIITKNVTYTGLVKYISLKLPDVYWAQKILEEKKNIKKRTGYKMQLLESNFSDTTAGIRLEAYYRELVQNVKR